MAMIPDEKILNDEAVERESSGDFVTVSRAELESLRARVDTAVHRAVTPDRKSAAGPVGCLHDTDDRDKGEESRLIKELSARDERVAALEATCKSAVCDRELATILAGKPLVPGTAAQLIRLWHDEFDVYEEDGRYKVAARDGRKPSQVIAEWLASPDYSHFCLPTSRGGTGARDTNRPASALQQVDVPKNLGEAIVMKWREESASRSGDVVKHIGLKRCR